MSTIFDRVDCVVFAEQQTKIAKLTDRVRRLAYVVGLAQEFVDEYPGNNADREWSVLNKALDDFNEWAREGVDDGSD